MFAGVLLTGNINALASDKYEVTARSKIIHYDIVGSTFAELRREMKAHSQRKRNKDYWGYTTREYFPKGGRKVTCPVIIINNYEMPRWKNRHEASAEMQQEWDRMYRQLLKHEYGHGRINIRAAHEHAAAGCDDRKKDKINKRRKFRNNLYDLLTRHGRLTGVYLR